MENIDNFANKHELKLYLDEFVKEIKYKVIHGEMDAETIRRNLILIPLLKDRNLSKIFHKKIDLRRTIIQNGKMISFISGKKLVDFIGDNEEFLRLCAAYGKFLDSSRIIIDEDSTIQELEQAIQKQMIKTVDFDTLRKNSDLKFTFEKFFEFIEKNGKNCSIYIYPSLKIYNLIKVIGIKNTLELAINYGRYMDNINPDVFNNVKDFEEIKKIVEQNIEENIKNRITKCDENAPEFFKKKYPQFFIAEDAPIELKMHFYGSMIKPINFIKNPVWNEFIKGKNLKLAISEEYLKLFNLMPQDLFLKLYMKNMRVVEQMLDLGQEKRLAKWYKKTSYRFVPSEEVMMNFPEEEIDEFLANGKKWSRLVKLQEDSKGINSQTALLKMAYCMGVFHGNDEAFKNMINWLSDLPKKLSKEEYEKIISDLEQKPTQKELFCQVYKLDKNLEYTAHINQKKDKEKIKNVRKILEDLDFPRILTADKISKIFSEFEMNYNPKFSRFLIESMEEILEDPDNMKLISVIQKQYDEILSEINSGKNIGYTAAKNYKKSIPYDNVDIGNEELAKQASFVRYSQIEFEKLQELYNEGKKRKASSIPRIIGEKNGYTYEMVRGDSVIPLTVGRGTGACIDLNRAAESCMRHSVLSPNGRVFIVRDDKKRIVAHSWFWRNQCVGCFDSIEIPKKLLSLYKAKFSEAETDAFLRQIIDVYKQASEELIQMDQKEYHLLMQQGKISKEQYEALVLQKITVGLGHSEIAEAIKKEPSLVEEQTVIFAPKEEGFGELYAGDSKIQYVLVQNQKSPKSNYENLPIYEDDIPVFNEETMNYQLLLRMRRMENAIGKNRLKWIINNKQNQGSSKNQQIMRNIASEYGFESSKTRVIATTRIAIIYSKDDEEIKIGDVFTALIKENLSIEKQLLAKRHLIYQIKKALLQIGVKPDNYSIGRIDSVHEALLKKSIEEIESQERNVDFM